MRVLTLLAVVLLTQPQLEEQPRRLEPGQPVVRALNDGELHRYAIALAADDFLDILVEQRGIDVTAALLGPDNTTYADANLAKGGQGGEVVTFIADRAGEYRLEIRSAERQSPAGEYALTLVDRRTPTAAERTLEQARRALHEARDLRQKGKYDAALPLAERAVALREKVLGPDHTIVAHALHLLAVIYDDKHEYGKAEAPNRRALAIREKAHGPDHPDVARSLFNLAWLAKVKQDFAESERLYRRALEIQERALGETHSEVATTLNDLAVLYNQRGNFDASIQVNQRVLAIRERVLGPDNDGVAKALNNLARGYENKGDYAQAEQLFQRALTIWEKAFGPDHPEVGFALDGLARIYTYTGDYVASEARHLRSLAIREKALGPDHTEVATTLNNLAALYRQMGDYAKAEPLLLRDLAITEKNLGPHHAFVAPTLANLSAVYQGLGDYARAESVAERALAIQEKTLGPGHASVGVTLLRLAQLAAETKPGDPAGAEALYQRTITVFEKATGPTNPNIASALTGLAVLAEARSDRIAAARHYQRALDIQESVYGPDHWQVARSLEGLARLSALDGDAARGVELLARAHDIRERHLDHNLALGSERGKANYLKLFADDIDHALSLHASQAPGDSKALELGFTTLLRRKGRALDAASDNIGTLRLNATSADRVLLDRLSDVRSRLSAVTLRGPGTTSPKTYQALLRRLQDEMEQLESAIGARSAAFRAQSRPVTLETVQAALAEGAALVEFALYRPSVGEDRQRLPRYVAYVLTPGGGARWADLGEAAGIDRAVEAWRLALRDPARNDAVRLARALDAKVMQPVRALVGNAGHMLVSPDGPLNLIPFGALVDEQGTHLVERYRITYLASGRDLLRLEVPRESRSPPLVVATPAFGEPALVPRGKDARPQVDYAQTFFGPLPGVADEVRALRELLPDATFLTGEKATERALRNAGGPRILHIATHGFFLRGDEARPPESARVSNAAGTRLGKWAAWAENPLLRSGLALAGANQGGSGEDEGVLTALEAAGLDLWGTKLVVLSACDTGVGEVRNGDGVYGLRRALVLAGSESQMMSLWPVSDRSTRDLMIGYYRRLMQGTGRSEALRQAQLAMLRSPKQRHPYYWASFIQSGEWASLDGRR